jgi:hypothetical protein
MKKKPSQVAGQKNRNADQTSDFPLPDPIELVQLAAILRPNAKSPSEALKAAVKWYFEAVLFACGQASVEIATLLAQKRQNEKRNMAREDIKKMQATTLADSVDFKEARDLLANPRKLAGRVGKLPREGESLPPSEPGMRVEMPLHALPGVKLKRDSALIENLIKVRAYALKRMGVKADPDAERDFRMTLEQSGHVQTFLLESVLRCRHETRNESNRESARRKSRQRKFQI